MFSKPKRLVKEVFLHQSASDKPEHDNIEQMRKWHLAPPNNFNDVGYHFYIRATGEIQAGRSLEIKPAAQGGHNWGTIAICLGGINNSFTDAQFQSMKRLCREIAIAYDYAIVFRGHKEVFPTECPHFDYKSILDLDENGYMQPGVVHEEVLDKLGFENTKPVKKKVGWWTRFKRLLFLN